MPDTDEKPDSTTDVEPAATETEKPKEPASPQYVTRQELDGIRALLGETVQTAVAESMRAIMANRVAGNAPALPEVDDVTDEALNTAIATGEGAAAAIGKRARAEAERARRSLTAEISPVRATGERSLQAIAMRLARQDMPHYAEMQKEVDQAIAGLSPELRTDPEHLIGVYDYLVGASRRREPERWRQIEERDRQKTLRAGATADATQGPTSTTGRETARGTKKLVPEDVLSPEALASLQELGRNKNGKPVGKTFEQFARDLGYEPDEYLAMIAESGKA